MSIFGSNAFERRLRISTMMWNSAEEVARNPPPLYRGTTGVYRLSCMLYPEDYRRCIPTKHVGTRRCCARRDSQSITTRGTPRCARGVAPRVSHMKGYPHERLADPGKTVRPEACCISRIWMTAIIELLHSPDSPLSETATAYALLHVYLII